MGAAQHWPGCPCCLELLLLRPFWACQHCRAPCHCCLGPLCGHRPWRHHQHNCPWHPHGAGLQRQQQWRSGARAHTHTHTLSAAKALLTQSHTTALRHVHHPPTPPKFPPSLPPYITHQTAPQSRHSHHHHSRPPLHRHPAQACGAWGRPPAAAGGGGPGGCVRHLRVMLHCPAAARLPGWPAQGSGPGGEQGCPASCCGGD